MTTGSTAPSSQSGPRSPGALLDTVLGKVSMYRLVIGSLLVLLAVAILFGALGVISYSPAAIAVSAAVAVGVALLSNIVFAALFRVSPHHGSSVITGLILAFLFLPQLQVNFLVAVAVGAFFASASKYVLAVRGRHIANPAAVGALVVTLTSTWTGLAAPAWWVATPSLLPFVAIAAFLILYRTRTLGMALIFVVIAAALATVNMLGFGTEIGVALNTAFTAYPVIFLAGFMLSEPLTLAPRRWQRFLVAAIVGVLFSTSFALGPVHSTPDLALVLGNVIAFLFGQRGAVALSVVSVDTLASHTRQVVFAPRRPLRFEPGQYLELSVPHSGKDARGSRRVFSIVQTPVQRDAGQVSVAMTIAEPGSSFKKSLLSSSPGTTLSATSVGGDFLWHHDQDPVLMVAGGIGITPFIAQLSAATPQGIGRAVLVYRVVSGQDIPFRDELVSLGVHVLLSAPDAPADLPHGWTYLGPDRVTADSLAVAVPDLGTRRALISGPPGLVTSLSRALRRSVKSVHTDRFSGY